jgi:formamidopyrimidine-DNA glycosylase
MPEAVEVRKFADILRANILGHKVTKINILKGRYAKKPFEGYNELIKELPLTIDAINTKGKFTYITLSNTSKTKLNPNPKSFYLFNTLGLSGGWTLKANKKSDFAKCDKCNYIEKEDASIYTYPNMMEYITEDIQNEWFQRALNHLNVEFITDKKVSFYFYDQLSFGTLKAIDAVKDKPILEKKLKELGADLMDSKTTFEIFIEQIRKKVNESKAIGNVIVNQKIISGVGNYLRADALWMAKISPFRKVSEVSDKELEVLYWSLLSLIWGDYNFKEGKKQGYIKYKIPDDYKRNFFVYKQEKDVDGNIVKKNELFEGSQKRFIYYVKEVQK